MEDVSRWHDARRIREYLDAVQESVTSGRVRANDAERFKTWLEWARRYADSIDPAVRAELPGEVAVGPTNTPFSELDVTSHTRPVLSKLGIKDTDELWRVTEEKLRAACQGRAGAVWDEITTVLAGMGYDVSKRKSGAYW
jgi:DNA-directed RNA polymerase alpha subunit